jgi:hypothetical protein
VFKGVQWARPCAAPDAGAPPTGCRKNHSSSGRSKRPRCKAGREPTGTHCRWVQAYSVRPPQRRRSGWGTHPKDGSPQMGLFQRPARPAETYPSPGPRFKPKLGQVMSMDAREKTARPDPLPLAAGPGAGYQQTPKPPDVASLPTPDIGVEKVDQPREAAHGENVIISCSSPTSRTPRLNSGCAAWRVHAGGRRSSGSHRNESCRRCTAQSRK